MAGAPALATARCETAAILAAQRLSVASTMPWSLPASTASR